MIDRLPERWTLPAPESQVLLTGPDTPNTWAVKLALKELVLRKALTLQEGEVRRFYILKRRVNLLTPGASLDQSAGRSLHAVLEVFPRTQAYAGGITGVTVERVAKDVAAWYRAGGGYVHGEVLPELERRGFYERTADGTQAAWKLTSQGEEKLQELRALLETGRQSFPDWIEHDRPRAVEFAGTANTSLLLLGNPAHWLWFLLIAVLAGETVSAESIPIGSPFPIEPQPPKAEQSGGDGGVAASGGESGADSGGSGGGGGGFTGPESGESPGSTIDQGAGSPGDAIDDGVDSATEAGTGDGE